VTGDLNQWNLLTLMSVRKWESKKAF